MASSGLGLCAGRAFRDSWSSSRRWRRTLAPPPGSPRRREFVDPDRRVDEDGRLRQADHEPPRKQVVLRARTRSTREQRRRGGERGRLTHFADVGVLRTGEPEPEAANGVADDPSQQYLCTQRARGERRAPLAPVVRQRDDDWMMIVKWTLYAMINAEELGITSKNIDEALKSKKPEVMRLVGTEGAYGEDLGLTKDWAVRIIKHVGNYGEVYDRNVGADSKLKIPRGMNQLWNAGGVQYAPPIR